MSCLICFEMKNTIYGKKTQLFFFLFEQIYKMIQKHWNCLNRTTRSAWLFLMKFQILLPPCSTRMSKVAKYPDSGFKHLKLLWSFRSTQFFFCTKSRIITLMISNLLLKNQKRKNYFSKFKLLCVCFQYSGFNMSFWKG